MKTSAQLATQLACAIADSRRRYYNVRSLRRQNDMSNDERKAAHLPHDGFKQATKDRARGLYNEHDFPVVYGLDTPTPVARAAPIVIARKG